MHKHMVNVRGQQRVCREVADVGVQPRRAGVVVAGGQVGIAHQPPAFAPGDEQHLGVGFQAHHAINHLRANRFEHFGPVDIGLFIKARLQLNHDHDFLAAPHGLAQQQHQLGISAGAVNGLPDRQHRRVIDRLAQESQHAVKTLEGLVNRHIALAKPFKNRLAKHQLLRVAGFVTRKKQLGVVDQINQLRQPRQVHRAMHPVKRRRWQIELPEQEARQILRAAR